MPPIGSRIRVVCAGCALVLATAAAFATVVPEPLSRFEGVARSATDGRVLYRELHFVRRADARVVQRTVFYTCEDGRPFARKDLNYADPLIPDLDITDARAGTRTTVTRDGGEHVITSTASGKTPRVHRFRSEKDLVVDAGFNELLLRKWDALVAGQEVAFRIVLLGSGSIHTLKARRIGRTLVAGEDREHFQVALGGLLGLIAPAIDVWYASSGHGLRLYEGVSNLRDERGREMNVAIDFPPATLRASSEAEWQATTALPLVRSCGS
jgi:hypothetical protein